MVSEFLANERVVYIDKEIVSIFNTKPIINEFDSPKCNLAQFSKYVTFIVLL